MHLIQQIGSYAGLASIPALCLLSALCFSQARDVRRLREWAGRAPERAAEAAHSSRGAVVSAPLETPRPGGESAAAAQPLVAERDRPAAVAPSPADSVPPETAKPPAPVTHTASSQTAKSQPPAPVTHAASSQAATSQPLTPVTQAASAVASARSATTERPPQVAAPLRRTQSPTPLLGKPSQPRFARPAARTLGLVAVILAALVAAAALAISQLSGGGATRTSTQAAGAQPAPAASPPERVAVLNGTSVPGLGKKVGARVRASGLTLGKVGNTASRQHATSLVLYAQGKQEAAQMVEGKLGIMRSAPSDAATESAAKGAPVIVVVGADGAGAR